MTIIANTIPDKSNDKRRLRRMRSLKGARIRFHSPVAVKEDVEIMLFPENILAHGKRVWQRGNDFGMKFNKLLVWMVKHDCYNPVEAAE